MPRKDQFIARFDLKGHHPEEIMVGTRMSDGGTAGLAGNAIIGGIIGVVVDSNRGMVQWSSRTLARDRHLPAGFIEPCQPVQFDQAPAGPEWIHEIKHDGWRIIARKSGPKVRLWTRAANEQTHAFCAIAPAVSMLPVTSLRWLAWGNPSPGSGTAADLG